MKGRTTVEGGTVTPIRHSARAGRTTDEQMKLQAAGGQPDLARSAMATGGRTLVPDAGRPALAHFYQPTAEDLARRADDIAALLRQKSYVVVPMKEQRDVVGGVLRYLLERGVPGERIIVSECQSGDPALRAVQHFADRGVRLIRCADVLPMLKWDELLPLLDLQDPPTQGKGMNMLCGLLGLSVLHPEAEDGLVFQHDADVRYDQGFGSYDALSHLLFPVVEPNQPGVTYPYLKIARAGRGNEATMIARDALGDMAMDDSVPGSVQRLAKILFQSLSEHKWMLTGEFVMKGSLAFTRPFATMYWEETLISMFIELCIALHGRPGIREAVAQIETVTPRVDDCNDDTKEYLMMNGIARFLLAIVRMGISITQFTTEDYRRLNERLRPLGFATRIPTPSDEARGVANMSGPVIKDYGQRDRIVMGVKTLVRGGFVDMAALHSYMGVNA